MKRDYLGRLSWAAHWRLPYTEAEDVISDYREIISQSARSEEELQRDLGKPWQVVRLVTQPEGYRRWVFVFVLLTAFLLLLPVIRNSSLQRRYLDVLPFLFLVLGLALSWAWFQWQGVRGLGHTPPRGLLWLLLLQVAGMVVVWLSIWISLFRMDIFLHLMESSGGRISGSTLHSILSCVLWLAIGTGILGLIQARLGDRRWRALYVLGLTIVLLSASLLALLCRMDLTPAREAWWLPYLGQYLMISLIGGIGTGISLC